MHIMVVHLPFLVKLEIGNIGFCGKRQLEYLERNVSK